jgi:hypothetical protein
MHPGDLHVSNFYGEPWAGPSKARQGGFSESGGTPAQLIQHPSGTQIFAESEKR